mgnify:CR=1 FL=1|tara:strand:- start:1847 stop:2221 length:375 start_codon:yes stop_codon:yes gene_type:complete
MTVLQLEQPDDLDIVMQRGSDLNLVLKFSKALTDNTLFLTVRDSNSASGIIKLSRTVTSFTTQDIADDTVTFTVPAQEMSAIPAGNYFYAIQEQMTGRKLATRMRGIFEIQRHAGVDLELLPPE